MDLSSKVKYVGPAPDKMMSPDSLKPHPQNNVIRGIRNAQTEEERRILRQSLQNEGLLHPIICYENSRYIIGGNTRYATLCDLGALRIPVQWRPRTRAMQQLWRPEEEIDPNHPEVLEALAEDNLRVEIPTISRYLTAMNLVEQRRAYGQPINLSEILDKASIGRNTYNMINEMREGGVCKKTDTEFDPRPDLYQELIDAVEGMTVKGQWHKMMDDHWLLFDPNKKTYYPQKIIEAAFNRFKYSEFIEQVHGELTELKTKPWFENVPDKNFKSAASHHIIAHHFVKQFNKQNRAIRAHTVENGGRYDIHFINKKEELINTLEIKTTLRDAWTTSNEKYGYALLFKFSEEMDRCFLINAFLDRSWVDSNNVRLWKKAGGGNHTMQISSLYNYLQTSEHYQSKVFGDIYVENSKVRISTEEISA